MNPTKNFETGNPVFDFQSTWRRRAALIQNGLIFLGVFFDIAAVVLMILPINTRCVHSTGCCLGMSGVLGIGGGVLIGAGILWGFFWRNKLRDDFQRVYGMSERDSTKDSLSR